MGNEKIKIFFILPTLYAGGAERVISFVSQNLCKNKFIVNLIIVGFEEDSKYVTDRVDTIFLNKTRVLHAFLPLIRLLYREKPQIVVSSISHLNTMMGLISILFKKTIFVGRHSAIDGISKHHKPKSRKSVFNLLVGVYSYGRKKLDYVICQSYDMKDDFLKHYKYKSNNVYIIHNPVTLIQAGNTKTRIANPKIKKFITIGRLVKIKGHIRLLNILSKLDTPFLFTIIGDGGYKEEVFKQIKLLNLENKINYISHTDNVYKHLIEHDMFLQGSYSEGFPNTLLESCAAGIPVIAFNSPGGTREIIKDGVNGYLVDDEDEFLKKLQENHSWESKKVKASVYSKFGKDIILKQYEELFLRIVQK